MKSAQDRLRLLILRTPRSVVLSMFIVAICMGSNAPKSEASERQDTASSLQQIDNRGSGSQTNASGDENDEERDSVYLSSTSPRNQSLEGLLHDSSPFNRSRALYALLSNMGESQVIELFEQSTDAGSRDKVQMQKVIIQRLTQLNPQRSLETIQKSNDKNKEELLSSLFKEWSHLNLEEAVSHARTMRLDEKYVALESILLERVDLPVEKRLQIGQQLGNEQHTLALIIQDRLSNSLISPKDAWNEIVDELQDDSSYSWLLVNVATEWVMQSGLEVLDEISESITNPQTKRDVLRSVIHAITEADPKGTFASALKLKSALYNSVVSIVIGTWARMDPRAALTATSQVGPSDLRRQLEESVVRGWSQLKPHDVLSELDSMPDYLRDSARMTLISVLARQAPSDAADLVAGLNSDTTKQSAAMSLVSSWLHIDHQATLDWVLNEPRVQDLKYQLLSTVLYGIVDKDPHLAMETALAQPTTENELGLETTVISLLTRTDFEKAIEFLPQVRDGRTKVAAFASVGGRYVLNGETDNAVNLAQQLPESDRSAYFQALVRVWAGSNPKGLLDSINQLPTTEIKSHAALVLATFNRQQRRLSDKQIDRAKTFLTEDDAEKLNDGKFEAIFAQ